MRETEQSRVQDEINKLKESVEYQAKTIKELEEKLAKPVKGWSPSGGLFVISESSGGINSHLKSYDDSRLMGVESATEEQAEQHLKFQKLQNWLYQLAIEYAKGRIDDGK